MYVETAERPYASTLCYAVEWDAMMRWINKDTLYKNLIADSSEYGNYDSNGNLIKTGNYEEYKIKNIYDLAGNVSEWTMETYGTNQKVVRGGQVAAKKSIVNREANTISNKLKSIGFRVAIYLK